MKFKNYLSGSFIVELSIREKVSVKLQVLPCKFIQYLSFTFHLTEYQVFSL